LNHAIIHRQWFCATSCHIGHVNSVQDVDDDTGKRGRRGKGRKEKGGEKGGERIGVSLIIC